MKIANFIQSTLKVVASEKVNISDDLNQPDSTKSISELLDDQTQQETQKEDQ